MQLYVKLSIKTFSSCKVNFLCSPFPSTKDVLESVDFFFFLLFVHWCKTVIIIAGIDVYLSDVGSSHNLLHSSDGSSYVMQVIYNQISTYKLL